MTAPSTVHSQYSTLLDPDTIAPPPSCSAETPLYKETDQACGLWLAESTHMQGVAGVFTGKDFDVSAPIGEPDIDIPIFDSNQNKWSPWQDIAWNGDIEDDLLLQNMWQTQSILPGVGSNVICATSDLGNIYHPHRETVDSLGVHRAKHPSAGSFSYRHNISFVASRDVQAGEELFTTCSYNEKKDDDGIVRTNKRSLKWLETNAICIDNLAIKPSTIPYIGRGAFAKRSVKKGQTIISSPVMQIDRMQTNIVKQFVNNEGRLEYTNQVERRQLLLNYCFGHTNSTVLLFPYGPGVNFINHNQNPNAKLVWSTSALSDDSPLFQRPPTATAQGKSSEVGNVFMLVDYVAIREIKEGEEIFIDYGKEWQSAWLKHIEGWKAPEKSEGYVSAAEYARSSGEDVVRTLEEQQSEPYPDNIRTACLFKESNDDTDNSNNYFDKSTPVYWFEKNEDCLRPCTILDRRVVGRDVFYTVEVGEIPNQLAPAYCDLTHESQTVLNFPEKSIRLVDKQYSSDQHLREAFRHEMGVPDGFFPKVWMDEEQDPDTGSVVRPDLKPGEMDLLRWKDNGEIVSKHAYLLGLDPKIRKTLVSYCDSRGIIDQFRYLTTKGNGLRPNNEKATNLNGHNWFIQRPPKKWKSNMHWISPFDEDAHQDYLRALSASGFDQVLSLIGETLGLKHLTCYHVTFVAISQCTQGYFHYDVANSGGKVFNVIIPLLLAESTGPELKVRSDTNDKDGNKKEGTLRYEYDVAALMGDDVYHGTEAIDYRNNKEMRLAATVYIAEITPDNVDALMEDYTQHYPPAGQRDVLLGMAGKHWNHSDPTVKLPEPLAIHTPIDNAVINKRRLRN